MGLGSAQSNIRRTANNDAANNIPASDRLLTNWRWVKWEYEENVLMNLINEVPTIKMHANRASWVCISAIPANSGSNRAKLRAESFSISR